MRVRSWDAALGAGLLVLLALVNATVCTGCGAGQTIVSAQATVHVATQQDRFAFYEQLDERCGAEHDERDGYRECMSPARHIARAADSYREALYGAQAALDAANEDGFQAMLPRLVQVATRLVSALEAAGVPVPEAVRDIAAMVGGAS